MATSRRQHARGAGRARTLVALTGLIGTLGLAATGEAAAAAPTCQGQPATVVGPGRSYELEGTAGDDVIETNGAPSVSAGEGDDLICVTGHVQHTDDGYQDVGVDAGSGDDRVVIESLGDQDITEVLLGEGADHFSGGIESDDVIDGTFDDTDGSVLGDAAPDVIDTGSRGLDFVQVGDGGPLRDQVTVPNDSTVLATASGLGPDGRLEGGRRAELDLVDEEDGAWSLDATGRSAALDGEPRLSWTGFDRYTWAVPGTLGFTGTAGADRVTGPLVDARLGAGDDIAYVWSSAHDATSTGTVDAGAGTDKVRVMAGSVLEVGGGGLVPYAPADVRLDVAGHDARFGKRPPIGLSGFEYYGAQSDGAATLTGGGGSDRLFGAACRLRITGGGGDDSLHEEPGQDSAGLDNPTCHGPLRSTLSGGAGDDRLFGEANRSTLLGGSGDDQLTSDFGRAVERGGSGSDVLHGGDGADDLHGGSGSDRLLGGDGDDRLVGGPGNDQGAGEDGDDVCVVEHATGACERTRGTVAGPAPDRPHVVRLHDRSGDVEVSTGAAEPGTGDGDLTSVRTTYRHGRVEVVSRFRSLAAHRLLDLDVSLRYANAYQLLYASIDLRTDHDGRAHVRAVGDGDGDGACPAVADVDRRGGTVTVSTPAACLGDSRWVQTAVYAGRTDDRSHPTYVATDRAPEQHAKVGQFGPRAFR